MQDKPSPVSLVLAVNTTHAMGCFSAINLEIRNVLPKPNLANVLAKNARRCLHAYSGHTVHVYTMCIHCVHNMCIQCVHIVHTHIHTNTHISVVR